MDEHKQWTDFLGQLDDELAAILEHLEETDLSGAIKYTRALCKRRTRTSDTNQSKRLLDEPGKFLIPGWEQAAPADWVFNYLAAEGILSKRQAKGLYDVFGYLAEFLRERATALVESETAPNAAMAIKRYLRLRERPVGLKAGKAPKRPGPKTSQLVSESEADIEAKYTRILEKHPRSEWKKRTSDLCKEAGLNRKKLSDLVKRTRVRSKRNAHKS